jgi:hypothetical protein
MGERSFGFSVSEIRKCGTSRNPLVESAFGDNSPLAVWHVSATFRPLG